MRIHPFLLESPLPIQECIHRLQLLISKRGMGFFSMGDFGDEQFHGIIDGNSIELRKRKSWFWRNDFAPHLFAELQSIPTGTRIEGHFGIDSRVSSFMNIWLIMVAIFGCAFIIQFVKTDADHRDWTGVVVPLGMAAWGFVL